MKILVTNNLTGITEEVEVEYIPFTKPDQVASLPTLEERVVKIEKDNAEIITVLSEIVGV